VAGGTHPKSSDLASLLLIPKVDQFGTAGAYKIIRFEAEQSIYRTTSGIDHLMTEHSPVDKRSDSSEVPEGWKGADRVTRHREHRLGIGQVDLLTSNVQHAPDGATIDAPQSVSDHEQRLSSDNEQERLHDLIRRGSNCGGCRTDGRRLDREEYDLSPNRMDPDEVLQIRCVEHRVCVRRRLELGPAPEDSDPREAARRHPARSAGARSSSRCSAKQRLTKLAATSIKALPASVPSGEVNALWSESASSKKSS